MEAVKTTGTDDQLENVKRHRIVNRKNIGNLTGNVVSHIFLIAIVFLILFPFVSKIATTFQSNADLIDNTVQYIPKQFSNDVLINAVAVMDYWNAFRGTFVLSLLTGLAQTIACTFIAYGFARYDSKVYKIAFGLVLFVLIVPPQIIMSALYLNFSGSEANFSIPFLLSYSKTSLQETWWPFAILSLTGLGYKNALYVYMMRQFFRGMPTEIEEAGMIDGTGHFGVFFRLMIPNSVPMMVTIFLFAFSWQWTDYYYTGQFGPGVPLLSRSLNHLVVWGSNDPNLTQSFRGAVRNTGIIIVLIPLVLVYLVGQRFFVQGISRSGIVG